MAVSSSSPAARPSLGAVSWSAAPLDAVSWCRRRVEVLGGGGATHDHTLLTSPSIRRSRLLPVRSPVCLKDGLPVRLPL